MYRTELKVIVYSAGPFEDYDVKDVAVMIEQSGAVSVAERTRVHVVNDRQEGWDKLMADNVPEDDATYILDESFEDGEEEDC